MISVMRTLPRLVNRERDNEPELGVTQWKRKRDKSRSQKLKRIGGLVVNELYAQVKAEELRLKKAGK